MKIKKNTVKIIFDAGMAVLLILMYSKNVISLEFHEFGGLFLCVLFLLHNLINAKWIKVVSRKLFSKTIPVKTKILWLNDFLLVICFLLIAVSGILISKKAFPALNTESLFWKKFHFSLSAYAIILIGVHIGLHWNFIKNTCCKFVKIPRRIIKPLYAAVFVLILAAGFYNGWNSNFKRWIMIPFEGQTAAPEMSVRVESFQRPPQPPFSFYRLFGLLFQYGSITVFFAVLCFIIDILIYQFGRKKLAYSWNE